MTKDELITKYRTKYGKIYDYSLVPDNVTYNTKITLNCDKMHPWGEPHGCFPVQVGKHLLRGDGCTKCSGKYKRAKEDFVKEATFIHKGLYTYEDFVWKGTDKNGIIHCTKHHLNFKMTPNHHLLGQGCPECGKIKARNYHKHDYKSFLKRFNEKYGTNFEFPYIEKEYENEKSIVTFVCKNCGRIHTQKAQNIFANKYGCTCKIPKKETKPKIIVKKEPKTRRMGRYTVLDRIYSKYPTVEVFDINEYKDISTPLHFKCKDCGHVFPRKPNTFLYGHLKGACPKCVAKIIHEERTKTQEQFEQDVYRKYGKDLYTVVGKYISSSDYIKIQCNDCGKIFPIAASSFLQGHGCPFHSDIESKMEKEIEKLLKAHNLIYKKQKTFGWLKNKTKLKLDFYLPQCNIAIECQGLQHFHPIEYFGGEKELKNVQYRDTLKNELCSKHNIKVVYYANYHIDFPYEVYEDKNKLIDIIKENKNATSN